jgi:hypothetical protein
LRKAFYLTISAARVSFLEKEDMLFSRKMTINRMLFSSKITTLAEFPLLEKGEHAFLE